MLDMRKDRLNYGRLLECPPRYRLSFALGTTYSLDLEALMGVYMALGLSVDTDSAVGEGRDDSAAGQMRLFAALREVIDKVLVFCEKGKVRSSKAYNQLYPQIEDSIVEVDLEDSEEGKYPSFHPKLWILRFEEKDNPSRVKYRVCALSRNISFDSSWDVAGVLEGELDSSLDKRTHGGLALEMAVRKLEKILDKTPGAPNGIEWVQRIANELGKTKLRTMKQTVMWKYAHPILFSDPWNAKGKSLHGTLRDLFAKCTRALIMTPFLSDTKDNNPVYELFNEGVQIDVAKSCVVVRRDALLGQGDNVSWLKELPIYALRVDLTSSDLAWEGEGESVDVASAKSDIHAKLFVLEESVGDDSKAASKTHLFFGSANATRRAMVTNWEAMIHLESTQPKAFDNLLSDLGIDDPSGSKSLFERLSIAEVEALACKPAAEDGQVDRDFDHFMRRLRGRMSLLKNGRKDGLYDVRVELDASETDPNLLDDVEVCLMSFKGQPEKERAESFVFRGVALEDLTEFVAIGYAAKRGLIKCNPDTRLCKVLEQRRSALFKSFFADGTQSLLDYLSFRLSSNVELDSARMSTLSSSGMSNYLSTPLDGLYEKLIKAYADDPERAKSVVEECLDYMGTDEDSDILMLLKAFQDGTKKSQEAHQKGGRCGER